MKTKLMAALFVLTLPLVAQSEDRVAQALRLEAGAKDGQLSVICTAAKADDTSIGIVVASLSGQTMRFPGLPALLVPEAVLACGPLADGLQWHGAWKGVPFDLHLQAAGIVAGELLFSERRVIARSSDPDATK